MDRRVRNQIKKHLKKMRDLGQMRNFTDAVYRSKEDLLLRHGQFYPPQALLASGPPHIISRSAHVSKKSSTSLPERVRTFGMTPPMPWRAAPTK